MVNRMRHNRSHRGNVRSHHALKGSAGAKCQDCGTVRLNHHACGNCGKYNGRVVLDVGAKLAKKTKKASKKSTVKAK